MKIKKITLGLLAGASILSAGNLNTPKPFEGINYYIGGSLSDADDTLVECRISLTAAAEYNVNDFLATEARYSYGLGEHYSSLEAFIKPKYKKASLLLGYGHTKYMDHDLGYSGMRAGVQFNLFGNAHIDIVHRFKEKDTSIGATLKF